MKKAIALDSTSPSTHSTMATYSIPVENQYMVGDERYFKMIIPGEAKLSSMVSATKTEYLPFMLRDIQISKHNLSKHKVVVLRAIVQYILRESPKGLTKKQLVELILQKMSFQ